MAGPAGVSAGDALDLPNLEPCPLLLAVLCVLRGLRARLDGCVVQSLAIRARADADAEAVHADTGKPRRGRCLVPWPSGKPADLSQDMFRDIG